MTIGDRIRRLRGEMSQVEFAEYIGIPKNTIGGYERGERIPGSDALIQICASAGVSADWLLLGRGEMTPASFAYEWTQKESKGCEKCSRLEEELQAERDTSRGLSSEYRELVIENRQLWKENKAMAVELERMKARAAPNENADEDGRQSA